MTAPAQLATVPPALPDAPKKKDVAIVRGYKEIPTLSITKFDKVDQVRNALTQLMSGYIGLAAEMVDAFIADDRIASVFDTRTTGLLGLDMDFQTGDDDAAQEDETVIKELRKGWDDFFPEDQLAQLFKWGIFLGAGVGQISWEYGDRFSPKLDVWHPRNMYWNWTSQSYWINHEGGQTEVRPGQDGWILYTPFGLKRGWMNGLVRRLAIPWLMRQWAFRDWARSSEVYGMPTRKGYVPSEAAQNLKDDFLRSILALSTESVIMLERPQTMSSGESAGFDLELLEASEKNGEIFEKMIQEVNSSIAISLLGQNLTTEVTGSSLAAAQVHRMVRQDYLKSDSKTMGNALHRQVLRRWAEINFGSEDKAPKPRWQTDPPEDLVQWATSIKTLGEGIGALKAAGVYADVNALAEKYELPLVDDATAAKMKAVDEAKNQAKLDAVKAQPKPPKETAATMLTKDGSSEATGLLQGQAYADSLADDARDAAKRVLAPDLRTLLSIIEDGRDFESIRKKLLAAYPEMSPTRMAALTEKALIMAELNGQYSVLEDL